MAKQNAAHELQDKLDDEYIEIELSKDDCATIQYIINGKKDFINMLGEGKILIKRKKW